MIYLSAGHHYQHPNPDPGAVATHNGKEYREADIVRCLRDLICKELDALGAKYTTDRDDETLTQYLKRIKPGSGSVVCELHINSALQLASGTEVLVKNGATALEMTMARKLANAAVVSFGYFNRGVKTEAQSHRGKLGILNTKAGISALIEVFFINNVDDIDRYYHPGNLSVYASRVAMILHENDKLYT